MFFQQLNKARGLGKKNLMMNFLRIIVSFTTFHKADLITETNPVGIETLLSETG